MDDFDANREEHFQTRSRNTRSSGRSRSKSRDCVYELISPKPQKDVENALNYIKRKFMNESDDMGFKRVEKLTKIVEKYKVLQKNT